MLLMDLNDAMCCVCDGQLEITGYADAKIDVECVDCHERTSENPDDFYETGVNYRALAIAEFGGEPAS